MTKFMTNNEVKQHLSVLAVDAGKQRRNSEIKKKLLALTVQCKRRNPRVAPYYNGQFRFYYLTKGCTPSRHYDTIEAAARACEAQK